MAARLAGPGLKRRKLLAAIAAIPAASFAATLPTPSGLLVYASPVWKTVPNIVFTQGVARRISIAEYVTGPVSIALSGKLPQGVSFDGAGFVYDGKGQVSALVPGFVLTADDGMP